MKVIERVIKHQPPYYNTVPHEVSVKSDCIELLKWDVTNTIYYRNIGNVVLNKTDIWYAEINDRLGHWMCYVYSFDESEAKLYIDAIYTMMAKQ